MELIAGSFISILTLKNIFFMTIATTLGMMAGALPGFTATMAVALMVPFTFTMEPVTGLVTIAALYCATIYGCSFSAILLNTPGTPSSIGTTFDGYPMAKNGRGQEAVSTATIASAVGGISGAFVLLLFALPLARVALKFGPPEYFWTSIFGLTIIASLSSGSQLKGITGGVFGLLISMIGIAPVGGDVRFIMGITSFQGGVQLISVLIGFFCIPEILRMAFNPEHGYMEVEDYVEEKHVFKKSFQNVFGHMGNTIRSSIIGSFVGILPGAGGNIANLVAYNEAKRASNEPETFGKGNPQGIVATESANNAVVEGAMVPLLALGIPGSPPAAIIYGALMLQGLSPGPELFTTGASITYAFILSFFVANIIMFIIGIFAGRGMHKIVLKIPTKILIPSILLMTVLGSYSIRGNAMDVMVMFISGIIGFYLKKMDFHPAPIVLGLILGPIAEKGLVQGFLMGNVVSTSYPWIVFFTRPLSFLLIVLCIGSASWPFIQAKLHKAREAKKKEFSHERS